jgi:hypothetical protein
VIQGGKRLIFGINRHRAWQIIKECAEKAGLPKLVNPETGRVHNLLERDIMQYCWTCGTEIIGHHFTCNVCAKTRTNLSESPRISKSTTMSKFIEYSITKLFFGKEDTQLYIAADVSSNLVYHFGHRWGFEELSLKMDQMTAVLQSIDHSLKTPDETKANEQRLKAEELRRMGLLADSEKFFLQSLELNPSILCEMSRQKRDKRCQG